MIRPDDKVLLLDIPSTQELAALARILLTGSIVALGSTEAVDDARRTLSEFDNVMFVRASPIEIPWRDHFFTKIMVPAHLEPLLPQISVEIHRVLAPGGEIVRTTADA